MLKFVKLNVVHRKRKLNLKFNISHGFILALDNRYDTIYKIANKNKLNANQIQYQIGIRKTV